MIHTESRQELAEALEGVRRGGRRLALVPTMGYLHEGHLSLVDLAREKADLVAATIFVNPLQFGPGEDYDRYPRDLNRDLGLLRARGVDLVFCPSAEEMYPDGQPQVTVRPGPLGGRLCGQYRPGHFEGVLTVVARLFGLFRPHVSVFGQKDFQQVVLIRRMARDLELGVQIEVGPVVREADGLALSSRNVLLSAEERGQAKGIHRGLLSIQGRFSSGTRTADRLLELLEAELRGFPLLDPQYCEIVDPETLEPLEVVVPGSIVLVAAHCGQTRLIDNHIFRE